MAIDLSTQAVARRPLQLLFRGRAHRAFEAFVCVVFAHMNGSTAATADEVRLDSDARFRMQLHLDRLSSDDAGVRRRAVCALVRIGRPTLEQFLRRLVDGDLPEPFIEGLSAFKESAVPALLALLDNPDTAVRDRAIRVLGEIGFPAAGAASALTRFLDPADGGLCASADNALRQMGCAALPALLVVLNSEDSERRELAAGLIEGAFYYTHKSVQWEVESAEKKNSSLIAVEALVGRLAIENDSNIRCRLVQVLATIGEQHQAELISRALAGVLIFELLPLNDGAILEFLHVQAKAFKPADIDSFERDCHEFVGAALRDQETKRNGFAREILSNPVDLRIVAELLGQGITPDLRDLHGQRYRRMAIDYERRHQHDSFPVLNFVELAYRSCSVPIEHSI